jgi:hypothetical protein
VCGALACEIEFGIGACVSRRKKNVSVRLQIAIKKAAL